jgi:Protein of unknown function (DUF1566)/Repeat of unknown function (DUF5648)
MKTVQRFIGKACLLAAALGLAAFGATSVSAASATAVEYHYSGHYFMTAFPDEILAVDSGVAGGWKRTGYSFKVQDQPLSGYRSVCRFYLTGTSRGSHFYTADAAECAGLKSDLDWKYETVAFSVPPTASDGSCLSDQVPVYRLYNNRLSGVPNHRYTTCSSIRDRMASGGWIAEGVAMCVTAASSDCGYPVVDTGQTKTYGTSVEIAVPGSGQAFYGQDAQFTGTQPSYTKSSDGLTVKDQVTDLTWQKSPDTNGDGVIDSLDKMTLTRAQARPAALNAAKYGGYDDWRLPTLKELYSLMNFMGTDPGPGSTALTLTPFIDRAYFGFGFGDTAAGERVIDAQYASSNRYVSTTMRGEPTLFGVNFADGRIKGYGLLNTIKGPGDATFYVRLVRGAAYGVNNFVDNGDSTITDRATGQMWTKGDSGKGLNWQGALTWAQTKNAENYLGHSDWRLPNAKELQAIVDYTRSPDTTFSAAIHPLFTCTAITNEAGKVDYPYYWTNTTHISSDGTGAAAIYIAFGRAMGYVTLPSDPTVGAWLDVHGAGAQRSDPKAGNPSDFPKGHGPQGDAIRIYNYVRLVRGTSN